MHLQGLPLVFFCANAPFVKQVRISKPSKPGRIMIPSTSVDRKVLLLSSFGKYGLKVVPA
jgi:hypothetical protein